MGLGLEAIGHAGLLQADGQLKVGQGLGRPFRPQPTGQNRGKETLGTQPMWRKKGSGTEPNLCDARPSTGRNQATSMKKALTDFDGGSNDTTVKLMVEALKAMEPEMVPDVPSLPSVGSSAQNGQTTPTMDLQVVSSLAKGSQGGTLCVEM